MAAYSDYLSASIAFDRGDAGTGDVDRAQRILIEVLERNPSYGPAKRALADLDTHGEAPSARLSEE